MVKIRYEYKLLSLEIVTSIILSLAIFYLFRSILSGLNYEKLLESFVALNSGIIIAIFLALFHSSNEDIAIFKKFKTAAKQMYSIFLINSIFVCSISLFITNISGGAHALDNQAVFNVSGISLAAVATFMNVRLVYKVLSISFRR